MKNNYLEIPEEFISHFNLKSNPQFEVDFDGKVFAPNTSQIAFDLDGTLAEVDRTNFSYPFPIGPMNPKMKKVLDTWIKAGFEVVLFTARDLDDLTQKQLISEWLLSNGYSYIPFTNKKSYRFLIMYDDRAIGIDEKFNLKL